MRPVEHKSLRPEEDKRLVELVQENYSLGVAEIVAELREFLNPLFAKKYTAGYQTGYKRKIRSSVKEDLDTDDVPQVTNYDKEDEWEPL